MNRIRTDKPTLFLIEAAAGFGKTCTAYELVNLLTKESNYLPLFSELSRNRQATIFRYILLDEIDRKFPILSSRLVQAEMKNGRVITILDGFDELLRKNDESTEFGSNEPMLETIGEFLSGHAKIVLTTRRTILFEGDAFHQWVDKHSDDFDLIRIKINEPQVSNWLPISRINSLNSEDFSVEKIANPVLLSYLRCIPDNEFIKVSNKPHSLVDKYFNFMLEREITRQDLRMSSETQSQILLSIAEDMVTFSYTSEQRDYIVDHILRTNSKQIEDSLRQYPSNARPSKDEIANKLASHALLDKSNRDPNKIGFINEFVLGNYVAEIILKTSDWLNDDNRFIEPAVASFQPRSKTSKSQLWHKLRSSIEYLPSTDQVDISLRLNGNIPWDLLDDEVHGLEFSNTLISPHKISNFQFNECIFRDCLFDLSKLDNVTFLGCKYYGNTFSNHKPTGRIYALGSSGDLDFINALSTPDNDSSDNNEPDRMLLIERFILEKFWPVGRDTVSHKHRPIKGVCVNSGEFQPHELHSAITSLKRKGILKEPMQSSFLEMNFEEMLQIREILGRGNLDEK